MSGSVVPLREALDEERFGGKAVQLGAALRAGLPVPDGVALEARLVALVADGNAAARDSVFQAIASLAGSVAVRSSAIGEDSTAASFAGQHLTVLNVSGGDQAVDAVCRVAASAVTESAMGYRRKMGIEGTPEIGVVMQRLVPVGIESVAGVLFTRDPISGNDERVIEAAWGLGETVVSGLVTPDRYRISRSGDILERSAGEKDLAIVPSAGGNGSEETTVPADRVHALCLDDRALDLLHALASKCEEVFGGSAHDMEFAFAGGELFLLQRRAVTR